jgi:hypothetical protein
MAIHLLRRLWLPLLAGIGLAQATATVTAQTAPSSPSATRPPVSVNDSGEAEARLARRIARALEADHTEEARVDAEAGMRQFPESSLLRRRRAQVWLCLALQLDGHFAQAAEDAIFARALTNGVNALRNPGPTTPETPQDWHQRMKAMQEKLLTPEGLAAIEQFQAQARKQLEESGPLPERRSHALQQAFSDLKEAR